VFGIGGVGSVPVLGIEGAISCFLLAGGGCDVAGGTYLSGCRVILVHARSSSSPVVAGPLSTLFPPHEQRGLVAAVGGGSSLV
jgi:hypothetical protein